MLGSSSTIKTLCAIRAPLRPVRGQLDDETRVLAGLALGADRPAVLVDDAEADREPEPVPPESCRVVKKGSKTRSRSSRLMPTPSSKNSARTNSRPPRADAQELDGVVAAPLRLQRVVCVADHVEDDLPQGRAVGAHRRQVRGHLLLDADAVLLELAAEERERRRDGLAERDAADRLLVVAREREQPARVRAMRSPSPMMPSSISRSKSVRPAPSSLRSWAKLMTPLSGLLISCATPAESSPSEASLAVWKSCCRICSRSASSRRRAERSRTMKMMGRSFSVASVLKEGATGRVAPGRLLRRVAEDFAEAVVDLRQAEPAGRTISNADGRRPRGSHVRGVARPGGLGGVALVRLRRHGLRRFDGRDVFGLRRHVGRLARGGRAPRAPCVGGGARRLDAARARPPPPGALRPLSLRRAVGAGSVRACGAAPVYTERADNEYNGCRSAHALRPFRPLKFSAAYAPDAADGETNINDARRVV